jgi:hypothetical protein
LQETADWHENFACDVQSVILKYDTNIASAKPPPKSKNGVPTQQTGPSINYDHFVNLMGHESEDKSDCEDDMEMCSSSPPAEDFPVVLLPLHPVDVSKGPPPLHTANIFSKTSPLSTAPHSLICPRFIAPPNQLSSKITPP